MAEGKLVKSQSGLRGRGKPGSLLSTFPACYLGPCLLSRLCTPPVPSLDSVVLVQGRQVQDGLSGTKSKPLRFPWLLP